MTHLQALAMLLACVVVSACGNKGDLFLVPSEATEADLENVDEVLDELEGGLDDLRDRPVLDEEEGAADDEDNKDDDDRRKKKTP